MSNFQKRNTDWIVRCFGAIAGLRKNIRSYRFFEEATELVQSTGMTRDECHQLVDYVFDRPVGEQYQEVGGTMVTLAGLCTAHDIDMMAAGEAELFRVNDPVIIEKIRQKQKMKPLGSPLPGQVAA